jgi:hypothetical protein
VVLGATDDEGVTVEEAAGELGDTEALGEAELEGADEGVVLGATDDEGVTVEEAAGELAGELVGVAELEGGTVEDLIGVTVELGVGVAVEETTGGAQLYRISLMCSV